MGLVEPYIVTANHGSGDVRVYDLQHPMPTITGLNGYGLAQPYVFPIDNQGSFGDQIRSVEQPLGTIMTKNRFALAQPEPYLAIFHGHNRPGGERVRSIEVPFPTISAEGQQAGLVQPYLVVYNGTSHSADINEPMPTITGVDRLALCVPVLFGGDLYNLYLDVLFRMFEPHELAAAMAFPKGYRFVAPNGKPVSKRHAVKMIGNAVEGYNAEALCFSQLSQLMVN
jgi:DNA (cytosine-5)-methyltransferase 1